MRREFFGLTILARMAEDFFALLGEQRRPWLDPERVKDTFHRLSRTEHPDQQSGPDADADFARLNQAQAALRDPKARLRHLLELEFPQVKLAGPTTVPATLADLFAPVHGLFQEIDALLAKKSAAPSALARRCLAREEHLLREKAEARLEQVESLHAAPMSELQAFDVEWANRPADAASRLHDFLPTFRLPRPLDRPVARAVVSARSVGKVATVRMEVDGPVSASDAF